MKVLFGFWILLFLIFYSNPILAQDELLTGYYFGTCTVEKTDIATGQKQVLNNVFITMSSAFHEPNVSWELLLQYNSNEGKCKEAVYLQSGDPNEFSGLVLGGINCQGTFVTKNPSSGLLQGTMVNTKPTYSIIFKNISFYPIFSSED